MWCTITETEIRTVHTIIFSFKQEKFDEELKQVKKLLLFVIGAVLKLCSLFGGEGSQNCERSIKNLFYWFTKYKKLVKELLTEKGLSISSGSDNYGLKAEAGTVNATFFYLHK